MTDLLEIASMKQPSEENPIRIALGSTASLTAETMAGKQSQPRSSCSTVSTTSGEPSVSNSGNPSHGSDAENSGPENGEAASTKISDNSDGGLPSSAAKPNSQQCQQDGDVEMAMDVGAEEECD